MKSVIFRADSSSQIGAGHIMRCLVLAEQFDGSRVVFAVKDFEGNIYHKVTEAGHEIEYLESGSLEELAEVIKNYSADTVVIDSYEIDAEFERRLKEITGARLIALDDMYCEHHCDVLINHNIYADDERYSGLVPDWCELRCGAQYTLIRREFYTAREKKNPDGVKVFVAMGGADTAGMNETISEILLSEGLKPLIVTTSANSRLEKLRKYADENGVQLHIDSPDIASLMAGCSMAVVSASVTLNEVFFMGIPFVAIRTADNQSEMFEWLQKEEYCSADKSDISLVRRLIRSVFLSASGVKLLNFTDLSTQDKEKILEWRNSDDIRSMMYNTQIISLEEHLAFIDGLKGRSDKECYLVEANEKYIGVVNFSDISDESLVMGIYASPDARGVGALLMCAIKDYAFEKLKTEKIIAEVFEENIKAKELYKKHGFCEFGHKIVNGRDVVCMELKR